MTAVGNKKIPPVGVCIATLNRPDMVRRILRSLSLQTRPADFVLVVDASSSEATRVVCAEMADRLAPRALVYRSSPRGLPRQRRVAIDHFRRETTVEYIAFFDDDMVLEPGFLSTIVEFMESTDGEQFGGMSGYDLAEWGRPFGLTEKLYHRLGIFDGELRAGRWLYCGYFLENDRLTPSTDVHETDFLPGGLTVYRSEVFDHFLPPLDIPGYASGEDKHLSLRTRTRFKLAVHGAAHAWHLRAEGGRPRKVRFAYDIIRRSALMVRECDPKPTRRRYLAFLGMHLLNVPVYFLGAILRWRGDDLRFAVGYAIGWVDCVVRPPKRTVDALDTFSG